MGRKMRLAAGLSLLLFASAGCTVLEDRTPCPCYLDIDYRKVLESGFMETEAGRVEVILLPQEGGWCVNHPLSDCPELEEVSVVKSRLQAVAAVHSRPGAMFAGGSTEVRFAPGNQIDSIFIHTSEVDCSGEEARCLLEPRKQFSTLFFSDEEDGAICRGYNMVIRGTTCGFDAADCSPIEGEYLYTVQEYDARGLISVRIPRQIRDDLMLEFWDKDDHLKRFSCPVGKWIFDAGYDPGAEDLTDYSLRVDFRQAILYLRVSDWEEEYVYKLFE